MEFKFQLFRIASACAIAFLAGVFAQPAHAQSGGYDPRSWSFDGERGVLVAPGAAGAAGAAARPMRNDNVAPPTTVAFRESQPAGTIVINTGERALYYVTGEGRAIRYQVGVGREGFAWSGSDTISAKREWPDWHPPAEMRQREAARGRVLPARVDGGPNNPMGARALYIGNTLYRVHGTNEPWTVGTANSSGCIRMTNEQVIDLYQRVKVGARVVVRH